MKNILKEIETKYPVDTILVNEEQVWPYLRVAYYFAYMDKITSEKGEKRSDSPLSQRLKKMPMNSFYGFKNWFGKYDYIALSNTLERRNINGKYFNKLLDPILDELGRDKVLYVEAPAPSLYPAQKVHTKNIVCHDLLTLSAAIAVILQMFRRKNYMVQNESILKTIQKEYGLQIDDVKRIRFFDAQRRVFNFLFRKIKPKAILLSGYYGYIPAVKAAKDLGIKVIEFQHGAIGKEHEAYNVDVEIDKTYFPDHLLVFGTREIKTFDNSRFIRPEDVYPVGSFYIEHVRRNYKLESNLVEQLKNYKRSIGVTLAWTVEKRVIEFVCQAADLNKTIFYILIPRKPQEKYYSTLNLPDNVTVVKGKNFYELMMYVDFHSTVYSTCALEAPSFGVQNILINIDNLAKQYYEAILIDSRITRYADTPRDLVKIINTFEKLDRDTLSKLNEDIIATDYKKNIQNFVTRHLRP